MQVVSLLATVVEHLVTGETMQMATTSEQRCRYIVSVYDYSLSSNLDIYFRLLTTELTGYFLISHYSPINANNINLVLNRFCCANIQHGILFAEDILQDSFTDFKQLQGRCPPCRTNCRSFNACL